MQYDIAERVTRGAMVVGEGCHVVRWPCGGGFDRGHMAGLLKGDTVVPDAEGELVSLLSHNVG